MNYSYSIDMTRPSWIVDHLFWSAYFFYLQIINFLDLNNLAHFYSFLIDDDDVAVKG